MTLETPKKGNDPKVWRQYGELTAIPFILAGGPLIGYYMGAWVDRRFGTAPWATGILIALGFAAAVKEVLAMIRRAQ